MITGKSDVVAALNRDRFLRESDSLRANLQLRPDRYPSHKQGTADPADEGALGVCPWEEHPQGEDPEERAGRDSAQAA